MQALHRIEDIFRKSDSDSWEELIKQARKAEEDHVAKERGSYTHSLEFDPLFGYYVTGLDEVIKRLATESGILEEVAFIGPL